MLKKLVNIIDRSRLKKNGDETISELMEALRTAAGEGSKHAAVTSVYGAINGLRQELKDFGIVAVTAGLNDHELLAKLEWFRYLRAISGLCNFVYQQGFVGRLRL